MSGHDLEPGVPNLRPTSFRTALSVIGGLCGVGAFIASFAIPIIRAPREGDWTDIRKAVEETQRAVDVLKAHEESRAAVDIEREKRRDLEFKELRDLITRRR